ncbi:MAG: GNAT family N-acetyltransferase [Saprospiraceae bacterium]|nr:GNAT family N-acetyltransferase [Saprospiraceae bacterium]MDW8484797.1 GNAT family N-acetyltransferase [Saprospiraceae bacterium]
MLYISYADLKNAQLVEALDAFVEAHPHGNYFQSSEFFRLIETVQGYRPFVLLSLSGRGAIEGSLMGVIQSDGQGPKAWFSRRLIVWGGPLVAGQSVQIACMLLEAVKRYARNKAIFIEFRNLFDCTSLHEAFLSCGFHFRPHLNYIVKTDDVEAARSRLSSNRRRQIKTSLAAGATVAEAESEAEVMALYEILKKLYREKVKKPLPGPDLFVNLWKSPSAKVFVVKHNGKVVGGSIGPVYRNKVLYQWYVCGENGAIPGVHPSVLASWAPIEYGARHGFEHFDFMGAGRPNEDYGVREFKARFGGQQVCYGRYELVLNRSLYEVGKLGLKIYQYLR